MEQFLNPALRSGEGIQLGDALKVGGMVTGVGLFIVFSVLVILMIVLMLFKIIFYRPQTNKQKNLGSVEVKKEVVEVKEQVKEPVNDEELIAILTAAIAASLNTSTYNLKIKSYRRVGNNAPSWNRAGLTDVIDSRY